MKRVRRLMRDLRKAGCPVNRKGRELIKEELKSAAMVGAVEERHRTLGMLDPRSELTQAIVKRSVLGVLGYED